MKPNTVSPPAIKDADVNADNAQGQKELPRISTSFVYPPIPNRNFDWSAVFSDSYDGAEDSENRNQVGFGATEEAAKADLIENYSP